MAGTQAPGVGDGLRGGSTPTGAQDDKAQAAKDKAGEVAGQAQEKAQQAAGQAKDQVRSQVDQRSTQAGEQVLGQASDLRSVGEKLREEGKDGPAKVADQVADRAERAGSWLKDSDADTILADVEDFARKQPLAVLAGGLVLGIAAARALKASSRDRYAARGATTPSVPAVPQTAPVTTGTSPGYATAGADLGAATGRPGVATSSGAVVGEG